VSLYQVELVIILAKVAGQTSDDVDNQGTRQEFEECCDKAEIHEKETGSRVASTL
jgi:hypothetical protein